MRNCKIFLIFFISLLPLLYDSFDVSAEVMDKIAAVVGDEVITESEIERIMAPIYAQYKTTYKGEELAKKNAEARSNILNQLIEDELVLCKAKKKKIEVDAEEVDRLINEIKSKFLSKEEFMDTLTSQGLTLGDLRKKYRDQIMMRKLVNMEVREKIIIDPTEVTNYYQSNKSNFLIPEEIKISNILIRVEDGTSTEKARDKASKLLELLKNGAIFSDLAKEYSQGPNAQDGGVMNFVRRGELIKEIDDVIFNLEPGEISDLIKSNLGYHIFKVEEKRKERIKRLDEVQTEIEDILFQEKAKLRFREWINGLKEDFYISIK